MSEPGQAWADVFFRTRRLIIRELRLAEKKPPLHVWEITPQMSAKDPPIKADSLDLVEMVMAFEDEWEITVPDDAQAEMTCIGDIANYICGVTGINEEWHPGAAVPITPEEQALREEFEATASA